MKRRVVLITLSLGLSAAFGMAAPAAAADTWPDKPVRFVVPFTPGGPSDIVLRATLEKMQPVLKQPLILENKPGAAGNVGAADVARSAPDGYTWLWSTDTVVTINPHVYGKQAFDASALMPVTRASTFSQTLVCNPSLGFKTLSDLVTAAKARPLSYASGGAGSPGHLATELLLSTAGIRMAHVPYKGPAPAMQDVMGGHIECGFLAGPTVLPQIQAGRLVALAVSGAARSPLLPDVPTVAESGYPGYDATFSLVLLAPQGTPMPIVERMQQTMAAALKDPGVQETLKLTDQAAVGDTPAAAAERLTKDSQTWGEVVRKIDLKVD
ncbi:tripartite tricarboxylate transporter substrate binding protein [Achromobacter sp. GG226]|uniref:Bug family tripartite tricarboxylate transporter substrate binding protein n=1 Tax=Verticiella alkaliphila TaxID=2779529 RepID=UPI001C0D0446|nr:tripartite tricarboxylate transporter substrate binding protein [Verticiella sp. GG226]MBU4609511.1 tripartite tricarboxylate transporter substrate binding protein [Verticiella sp. GG226]